jgi:PKD repeat protein
VGDGDGGTGTGATTVAVTNVAPQVPAPIVVAVPFGGLTEMQDLRASLTFTDPGVDDPHGCTVDHGDGFVAAGTVEGVVGQPTQHHCTGPVHAYADNGTYRVTITVSDDVTSAAGHVDLSIANVAPTVDVPVPSANPIDVGQPFSVSAGFTDPAGTVDGPYTCTVDLGAGTGPGTVNGTTCIRSSPGFATEGDRTIVVRVTDKDGGTGQSSTTVTVANLAPAVGDVMVTPHPSLEGGAVTAAATFSDGGDNGPYTCTVDHGDGSGPRPGTVVGDTCTGPSYVYDDNGAYTVTIAVTDGLGGTGSANSDHAVDNVAPTATFSVVPEEIFVTEQAQLRFDDPFDPSGADTTAGFQYDFDCDGDSIWDVVDAGPSTTCTYLVSGIFTPGGRIADKDAGATVYAAPLRILSLQEAVGVLAGQVDNVGPPSSPTRGQVRSLLAKLEQAVNRLDDDHLHTASQLIGAFGHEVDALERSGALDSDADELRTTAERIVLAITRSLPPSPSAH